MTEKYIMKTGNRDNIFGLSFLKSVSNPRTVRKWQKAGYYVLERKEYELWSIGKEWDHLRKTVKRLKLKKGQKVFVVKEMDSFTGATIEQQRPHFIGEDRVKSVSPNNGCVRLKNLVLAFDAGSNCATTLGTKYKFFTKKREMDEYVK